MLLIIKNKVIHEQIQKMAEDFDGYIKVVVNLEKNILAGGVERHFDGKQLPLKEGSKQEYLWGGGIDWETKEVDYNSIINLRPGQNNPSRDILSEKIRKKFDKIVKDLLF